MTRVSCPGGITATKSLEWVIERPWWTTTRGTIRTLLWFVKSLLTQTLTILICYLNVIQVGKAMSSNESDAYKIMTALDVDYVLVIFGGVIGYSGDDINKFLWMVRIAEGEHPKDIQVS
jgi:hypothetical protein